MRETLANLTAASAADFLQPLLFAAGCAVAALALARVLKLARDAHEGRWPLVPIHSAFSASVVILVLELPSLGAESWPGWVFLLTIAGIAGLAHSWVTSPAARLDLALEGAPATASIPAPGAVDSPSENASTRRAA